MPTEHKKTRIIGIILTIFFVTATIAPLITFAQDSLPLVSGDCGVLVDGKVNRECGYYDLLALVNRIIKWIIMISTPVAAGVFAYAGILYMTTGVSDKKAAAKSMLIKVFIGFVFILSAWLIVSTITNALLNSNFQKAVPVQGT